MSRLEQLLLFLKDDPKDPFNIYAVALEYQKTDQKKALLFFEQLLSEHTNYLPTYYHLGKLYQEVGNIEAARRTFEKGIEVATSGADHKALRELRNALTELDLD